jgi:hypothetical protein
MKRVKNAFEDVGDVLCVRVYAIYMYAIYMYTPRCWRCSSGIECVLYSLRTRIENTFYSFGRCWRCSTGAWSSLNRMCSLFFQDETRGRCEKGTFREIQSPCHSCAMYILTHTYTHTHTHTHTYKHTHTHTHTHTPHRCFVRSDCCARLTTKMSSASGSGRERTH